MNERNPEESPTPSLDGLVLYGEKILKEDENYYSLAEWILAYSNFQITSERFLRLTLGRCFASRSVDSATISSFVVLAWLSRSHEDANNKKS